MDVFEDLGSGSTYGEVDLSAATDGIPLSIEMTDAALADLNTLRRGLWAFGGVMAPALDLLAAALLGLLTWSGLHRSRRDRAQAT